MQTLILTTGQLVETVRALDGTELTPGLLAKWASSGLVVPSVKFPQRRGRYNGRVYNLSDLARVRLVVRLRASGVTAPQVRLILAYLDTELREVMRPKTTASLVYDGRRAYVVRPGQPAVDVPTGQLRLKLDGCVTGNERAAREAQRSA